ncbi:ribosomal lysine N-methyltransferase 4 isoform X3 [Manihot esculenta]|uniref:ribosomal lysine N-methyltransferase 4 isoform X3 n=1 Tax=Manihot esculenta TaxID=3983 RepID=UPI000B5D3806|nr:ribosomal lysine N-methyltransferase 4 isoform X3 [Manihot esculenta]
MLSRAGTSQPRWSLGQLFFTFSHRFSARLNFSSISEVKVLNHLDDECGDFLPWLERKAGVQVSSKLYIGKVSYGRSLFASRDIQIGDCILRVPYSVQISSDNLLPKASALLDDQVESVTKVAIALLVEQKLGWQESEWAHYVSCLPQLGEMNSTIFWSRSELDMICQSFVYQETIKQKAQLEKDFLRIKPALEQFPHILRRITFKDFIHAYALVKSRAWGSTKGVSLIPFADFLNHDGVSEAIVLNDEDKHVSEVIADRNYAAHEEVLIRYGKFSNATLLLDFGFTLPYNIHDQVKVQIDIPHHDLLRETKLEILKKHYLPAIEDDNGFKTSWDSFIIKEVKSAVGKGKGVPQSLRAFARVLCCTSHQDLSDLVLEAVQNDGRLARRPFKSRSKEIQAHEILLSHLTRLIEEYNASVKSLGNAASPSICKRFALRRQMTLHLLAGELRILKSASAWLKNYCASLL